MYKNKKITVFILCHNNEKSIERTIKMIPACVDEVFIMDNASTDRTVDVAAKAGAKVMRNKTFMGHGDSYIKALPLVGGDIVITTDAEGIYPVWKSDQFLEYLLNNDLDFLSVARFPLKDKYSARKRTVIVNYILTGLIETFWKIKLKDAQSRMMIFKQSILPLIKLRGKGIEFFSDIKVEAFKNKDIKSGEYHVDYVENVLLDKIDFLKEILSGVSFLVMKRIFTLFKKG